MSAMTDYLENALLDHVLGKTAFTKPSTVYLALFTSDPGETGSTAGEVATPGNDGYSRQAITSTMSAASGGSSDNASAVTFGPATSNWGTVTHVGFMDASTGGNMLMHAAMPSSKTIETNDSLQFAIGQLTASMA